MGLSVKEFMQQTGATYRQMDYWARAGMDISQGDPKRGSGNIRIYKEEAVPKVVLILKLSKAFDGRLTTKTLKDIFDHYYDGAYLMAQGVWLRWIVDGRLPYGPSEGSNTPS